MNMFNHKKKEKIILYASSTLECRVTMLNKIPILFERSNYAR